MNKRILTVTLNPALDEWAEVPGFRADREFRIGRLSRSAGGKGVNVTRTLRNLRVPCLATGFAGANAGAILQCKLDEEGIVHDFVPISGETRTNVTIFDPKTGKTGRIIQKGPEISSRERGEFLKKFRRLLGQTSLVVLSGSLPPGIPSGFYADLIRVSRAYKIPAVVDTSGPALPAAWKAGPFMVKPNRSEAESLSKRELNSMAGIKRAVKYAGACGIEQVIVSLGQQGALFAGGGFSARLKLPVLYPGHHSVGCGDALVGGFVAAWSLGYSREECCHWALAAGTANCAQSLPGDIDPGRFRRLLGRITTHKFSADR